MMIRAKPEVKYKLIQEMTSRDNNLLNITWLCEIAGVSRFLTLITTVDTPRASVAFT